MGVCVAVAVGDGVNVGDGVAVAVAVGIAVGVELRVAVDVHVAIEAGVDVGTGSVVAHPANINKQIIPTNTQYRFFTPIRLTLPYFLKIRLLS